MKTEQEILDEIKPFADGIILRSVLSVNHKPHQYMIGPAHIKYASEHFGGMLGKETTDKVPCAHPHCNLSYDEHTCERGVFISLTRELTNKEFVAFVQNTDSIIKENNLEGYCIVDTKERFRILPPVE